MMTLFEPARTPIDRLAEAQGHRYDPDKGDRPILFIERFCRQSQGRWSKQPLLLLDWQKDFLRRMFGWIGPDGTRRYRSAYLEVAKKNGKSTLLSGIVLYLLLADGEGSPKVFINACDKEQASIIFDEAAAMVKASPELSSRLEVVDSRKRIVHPAGNGRIQANSAEAPNKDGANASAVIFDELHRQKTRELWDMFEYAGASREQPLKISITTAGEDELGVWHEQRDYSERVNAGTIPDVTHLGAVYRADDKDDLDDPATWRKANPSLGHTIKPEDFARDYSKAKEIPTQLALFKRLRLNIITKTEPRFLLPSQWAACDSAPVDPEGLRGMPCWMGYDGSENADLTALATIFGDDESGFDLIVKFWMAEETVKDLERRDRVPYRLWIESGFIETTPGNVIDVEFVRGEILVQSVLFDLRLLFIDPWRARDFGRRLEQVDGITVKEVRQGYGSLSGPTAKLEALVMGRKLRHGNNPVLRWMAGNAIARKDANGNLMLDKGKSREKIDGMSATVNALAAMGDDPDAGASAYESRGIRSF